MTFSSENLVHPAVGESHSTVIRICSVIVKKILYHIFFSASSGISDELRFVQTSIITNRECENVFGSIVTKGNICATGAGGKSSCNGDSGGPMTIETNSVLTQVGIVSFGAAAGCERGHPHAYTRITEFLDWIGKNSELVISK